MNSEKCKIFIRSYSYLNDIAYYFTTGAMLVPKVDVDDFDPIIAHIFETIRPLAKEIEPHAKQLWYHMEKFEREQGA
ncbi:MAG TPA: hypothetical protein EYH05_06595 [Anaerolineae bacterium]|nr:hypothetical protein [Anaerolineae bacterium]